MKSYIIKIELLDLEPLIWRRVILPAGATFKALHDVIQTVTNFQSGYPASDYHLYEFSLDQENTIVTNDEEAYEEHKYFKNNPWIFEERLKTTPSEFKEFEIAHQEKLKAVVRKPRGIKIDDYLDKYQELLYSYDFGDGWEFSIKLEDTVDDYYFGYATLLDGAETAPPEDVGGLGGFYNFLKVYHDELHPEHQGVREWADMQRFEEYDPDRINEFLKMRKCMKTQWDKINHNHYVIVSDKYRKK